MILCPCRRKQCALSSRANCHDNAPTAPVPNKRHSPSQNKTQLSTHTSGAEYMSLQLVEPHVSHMSLVMLMFRHMFCFRFDRSGRPLGSKLQNTLRARGGSCAHLQMNINMVGTCVHRSTVLANDNDNDNDNTQTRYVQQLSVIWPCGRERWSHEPREKSSITWLSGERCWLNSLESHSGTTMCRDECKIQTKISACLERATEPSVQTLSFDRKRQLPL